MTIFTKSILNNTKINQSNVAQSWLNFQKFLSKVDHIRGFKEEEYQDGFLKDIFEDSLGYTLKTTNPDSFNLEREKRNETDTKKSDAVIYLDGEVVGVIELKDKKCKNLDKIESQAFNYHNSHSKSRYIIISNFDELRFYIDKKIAYEKFNLFSMDYEEFKKLYKILSYESIKANLPLTLKERSINFEAEITNRLYKDYRILRLTIFDNLCFNNENIDKLKLLQATQKLLDRLVFIYFAEDTGLIPPNSIAKIIEMYSKDWEPKPLYHYYKIYFKAIDKGNERTGISIGYNGELFKEDEFLDSLIIDNNPLKDFSLAISSYDFNSDISVNILGHIFENSLNELEELKADIEGGKFDIKKSKRKKDGVFYTPEYITSYILENTLGKLCEEYKSSHKLETKEELDGYREWLLGLKILDPACGSGAFLNQALEFLIKEHKYLNSLYATSAKSLFDYDYQNEYILQNNLYGVDINQEAADIAKLSLWLRSAKAGHKLVNLSEKIVCANSLLEMPFPEESFDVVVGNPPYGAKLENNEKDYYKINSSESAILFMQLSQKMVKNSGFHGFIIPKPFIFSSTWEEIRVKFFDEIMNIVDCRKVWSEVKLEQVIYIMQKNHKVDKYKNLTMKNGEFIEVSEIDKKLFNEFGFFVNGVNEKEIGLAMKMKKNKTNLFEISAESNRGGMFQKEIKENGDIKVLGGINIQRYEVDEVKGFINKNTELAQNSYFKNNSILLQRLIAHIQNPTDHIKIVGTIFKDSNFVIVDTIYQISLIESFSNKFILSILHSKLMNWYVYRFVFAKAIRTFQFSNDVLAKIPIPKISESTQAPFIKLVDEILESKQKLKIAKERFHNDLKLEMIPKRLENFEELRVEEFVSEYAKLKRIPFITKMAERKFTDEWRDLFESDKSDVLKIQNKIAKYEKEIDCMVYKLYNLTDEEIAIIESS